ncbi:MAG: tRNA (N(6)-L-threonylcarbamoyladenosine(37)-C(2))-methylthiotransferase MtaB [Alphaproteobacteria bacterium]
MSVVEQDALQIVTFGCRLNTYESEVMRRLSEEAGLEGAVIVNTCAVTNEATRQARQTIRKIARERPDAKIIVTGCAAQIEPESFAALPGVARVIGNQEKLEAKTWREAFHPLTEQIAVNDIMSVRETAAHLIDGFSDRARAYVQVQNGCDHRCTFCIIPYGRGPSRSVPAGEVVTQIRRLSEAGYNEVVLTGVDMTSWGGDLPGTPRLGRLVRQVLKGVPDLARLRLSSIDPVEIDEELMALIESEERLMPHLHLSIQAGDNMTLKRMKRRHLRGQVIALTERLRARRPEIVFGADLIAGFPTETAEMFENTLRLIDECDIAFAHVFPFSPKAGTPAARMPQTPRDVVKARAQALRERAARRFRAHLERQVGREVELLVERDSFARAPNFTPAHLSNPALPGTLVRARITGHREDCLLAEAIS